MPNLRDRGVYVLPDGKRYVARKTILGSYSLYKERGRSGSEPRYRVNTLGEVVDPVTLEVVFAANQLVDTGKDHD